MSGDFISTIGQTVTETPILRHPDWQDISTAPRDGTPFLAFLTVRNNQTGEAWPEINVIWADDGEGCPDWERGWSFEDYTHWMPLPAPPKEVAA